MRHITEKSHRLPRNGLYTLLSDILPALCAFVILPLISTLSGVQATFKTVCTTCAHNAPTAHASLHKKGMPNFVHLHRVPQPFVLREIENHVTGGRKTVHSSVHSTSHDKISYRTQQFYTLRNGCCQGVVYSCATTLHNFLRTVQTCVGTCVGIFRCHLRYITPLLSHSSAQLAQSAGTFANKKLCRKECGLCGLILQ